MNNQTRFLAIALCFALASCSAPGAEEKEQPAAPEGMVYVDLSRYGKPFELPVPDTSAAHLEIMETSDGALTIRSGRGFALSIYEQFADLKLQKQDVTADEVNRHRRWLADSADVLAWESAITEPQHHFVMNRHLADSEYAFSDQADEEHSEQDVLSMLESVRNAREKRR